MPWQGKTALATGANCDTIPGRLECGFMSKLQKTLTTTLWGLVVISMVALIAAWSGAKRRNGVEPPLRLLASSPAPIPAYEVPDFSLTDQDGKTVTRND